jgi:hypothetical protein
MRTISFLAAFICIVYSINGQCQTINTIAGGGSGGLGDGGPATAATMNQPYGVAVDNAGNFYVSEANNSRIRKVTPGGIITTIAGTGVDGYSGDGGPATAAQISFPYGITVDSSGNIYFAETLNHCIRKINAAGIISTVAGTGVAGYNGDGIQASNAQLNVPGSVAVDVSGNIYIADSRNYRVRKIDNGGIITTIGGTGLTGLYGVDGQAATAAGLYDMYGITVDLLGNVYIVQHVGCAVRKINGAGIITTVAGTGSSGYNGDGIATATKLYYPAGVCADQNNNIYITDVSNGMVRKVDASGMLTTVVGTGLNTGVKGDGGPAVLAELSSPTDVKIDASGRMYICDFGRNCIRSVTSTVFVNPASIIQKQLAVYPNPCRGDFIVNLISNVSEHVKITIRDLSGHVIETIKAETNRPINIHLNAAKGIYFLSGTNGIDVWEDKIVVGE